MNEQEIRAQRREQANALIWARTKPLMWSVLGGALGLLAGAAVLGIVAMHGLVIAAVAGGALFCGFKSWQAEEELAMQAQRIQANIDSNEFAREFSQAMYRSKTEGIDPVQALSPDLAQKVIYHQSLLPPIPSVIPGREDGKLWQDTVARPEPFQAMNRDQIRELAENGPRSFSEMAEKSTDKQAGLQ